MNKLYFFAFLCILSLNTHAQTTVVLNAMMDNTIYEENTANSNGAGQNVFAGLTNNDAKRRALVKFDLSTIPQGSLVTSATLTLFCNKANSTTGQATSLHKLSAAWGEGTSDAASNEGGGTAATANDATWVSRLHLTSLWTLPGGDFVAAASATTSVGAASSAYTWSSATVNADVQSWVSDPSTNFGWIVIGNESTTASAKRFASRQSATAAQRPSLSVTYTTAPLPVVLTSFTAKEVSTGTLLTWQTTQELNNEFFVVEHSVDGTNFQPVGKIKGNGNSAVVSNYQFRHEGLIAGRHFYRLVQIDISGKTQFSLTRTIQISKQSLTMLVNPNPVRDKIVLTSFLNEQGSPYKIVNTAGAIVVAGKFNPVGIDVKTLPPGTYYLRLNKKDGHTVTGIFYKN